MSGITVPSNVYNAVAPIAREYNVPDSVWETIAYEESGFNTQAVGDQGTSFGLFQLHEGGQLPHSYYSDPQAVFDPTLNAQLAMPSIAQAYQDSGTVNTNSLSWWEQFAANSGHPGGAPGQQVTDSEASKLFGLFPSFSGGSTGDPTLQLSDSTSGNTPPWCDMFPVLCSGQNPAGELAQGILQDLLGNINFKKIGLFVLGLALVIVALVVLLKQQGGVNA